MNNKVFIFAVLAAVPLTGLAQGNVDIVSPQNRMESIDSVRKLLTVKTFSDTDESLIAANPFIRSQPVAMTPVISGQPSKGKEDDVVLSDREKLQKIADAIAPSGTINMGNDPILLFGQKKFKVGDVIPIVFEEHPYEVKITAIERVSYTLRLNNEEITRPIKPVTTKP